MLKLEEDPASEHIREMAKYFGAELDNRNDASTIFISNEKANGFISSYRLFKGLSVWIYNIIFFADFIVDLGFSEGSPYYFSHNVKGHFLHRFGEKSPYKKILEGQNMIVIGSPEVPVQITFPKNIKLEIAVVIVDLRLLADQEIRNAKRIRSKIEQIFHKIPLKRPSRYLGAIDPTTHRYASIVCDNNEVDLVGGLLTEGAVLNMLASQLKSFSNSAKSFNPDLKLSKSELSKISSLGAFIIENIEKKFTLQELGAHFQLSPKKLQLGIKHLYGDTVGNYISNIRMGHAKHLFNTTDLNVSEVCIQIGLTNKSYFSKVFKGRFNLTPSSYRNRISQQGY